MRWQECARAVLQAVGVRDEEIVWIIFAGAKFDNDKDYLVSPELIATLKSFYEKYGLDALWRTLEMLLQVKKAMDRRDYLLREMYAQTSEEQRQALKALLPDETWSDFEIARRCGVSPMLVDTMRIELKRGG